MLYIDVKLKEGGKIVDPETGELNMEEFHGNTSKIIEKRRESYVVSNKLDDLADNEIMKRIRAKFREKFVISKKYKIFNGDQQRASKIDQRVSVVTDRSDDALKTNKNNKI